MSSKVAVEKTGIGITKLISSLGLQQTIYGGIYTKQECAQTSARTMFVHVSINLGVDNES